MKAYAKILGVVLVGLAIQLTLAAGGEGVGDTLVSRAFTVAGNINSLVSRAFTVSSNTDSLASRAFTVVVNCEDGGDGLCSDCDGDGISDGCELACGETGGPCDIPGCGLSIDCDDNGVPDTCEGCGECPTDVNCDGETGPFDLATLLGNWGSIPPGSTCLDANEDGLIGPFDLATLLGAWGKCP